MISADDIYNISYDVITAIIDDPDFLVIRAKRNAPEPDVPYCTVYINRFQSVTGFERTKTLSEDERDIVFNDNERQRVKVTIAFFKNGSLEHGDKIKQAIRRPNIIHMLKSAGVYLEDTSDVRDFTSVIGSGFEFRGLLDLMFTFTQTDEYVVERILSAEGDGKLVVGGKEEDVHFDTRNVNP